MIPYLMSKTQGFSKRVLGFSIIIVLAVLIALPFGVIWSINTLFNINNPYDFEHWIAVVFILILLAIPGGSNSKN